VLSYRFGGTHAELVARYVGRHLTDISAEQQHSVSSIAYTWAMATFGLGCAAVDDCDKIICDDDPVLAFLRGVFRYDALLYYFHC
jgi:hypothetical protein